MDTLQDSHPANDDSGFARMLRDGNREPLARAKETLKDRLLAKVRHDVLNEFDDTEEVVEEALQGLESESLDAVRAAYKQRLKEQMHDQVVHEVTEEGLNDEEAAEDTDLHAVQQAWKEQLVERLRAEALDEVAEEGLGDDAAEDVELHAVKQAWKEQLVERLRTEALDELRHEAPDEVAGIEDDPEARDALDAVKSAIKAQLMERLFQQAIAEIDHEVDLGPVDVLDADAPDTPSGQGRSGAAQEPRQEAASVSAPALEWVDESAEHEGDDLLDMHFWEEDEADLSDDETLAHSEPEGEPDEEAEGDDPDFFLEKEVGLNGAPGNALEIAFDGEAASDAALEAGAADLAGDGGWLHLDMEHPDAPEAETDAVPVEPAEATRDGEDTSDEATVYYVYGIVSGSAETLPDSLPEDGGVEGSPLTLISHEQMYAIVSRVPATSFSEEALDERAEDAAWIDAMTQAHDEVIEPFHTLDGFHAFPAFTVHPGEESVQDMLAEVHRLNVLEQLEGRSEWHVVLYRNRETLHQHVVESSDPVKELMAEIKNAPKGGAPSIKKKMVAAIQQEMARVTDKCTSRVHEDLLERSEEANLGAPENDLNDEKGEVVHAATYLVDDDAASLFNDGVAALRKAYADLGFVLDVTGPRPPALLQQLQQEEQDDA